MSQQKDIHLTYDLHELEEQPSLKSEGIARPYITVSASDSTRFLSRLVALSLPTCRAISPDLSRYPLRFVALSFGSPV